MMATNRGSENGVSPGPIPVVIGIGLVALLLLIMLFAIDGEIDGDEAVYLNIARAVSRIGKPVRTDVGLAEPPRLFIASPPFVMVVASVSQRLWPSRVCPSRLLLLAVFTLPGFLLAWSIARSQYGAAPACVTLLSLIGSGYYLRQAYRVRLDVPLSVLCLLSLWAFAKVVEGGERRGRWIALAAGAFAAAVLTKYQAVTVPAAVALYMIVLWLSRQRDACRRMLGPLCVVVLAGLAAGTVWVGYVLLEQPGAAEAFAAQVGRFRSENGSVPSALAQALALVERIPVFLGFPLMAIVGVGLVLGRRGSKLTALLACFCVTTILFNLFSLRLPGAGRHYLLPMVPAMAILAGYAASTALEEGDRKKRVLVFIGVLMLFQFVYNPPPCKLPGRKSRPVAAAAAVVRARSPRGWRILSTTDQAEFYADRPAGKIREMDRDRLLALVSGRDETTKISHIVIRVRDLKKTPWREEYRFDPGVLKCMEEHFERVRLKDMEDVVLLERKGLP